MTEKETRKETVTVKETEKKKKETEKRTKETERRTKETEKRTKETEKRTKEAEKQKKQTEKQKRETEKRTKETEKGISEETENSAVKETENESDSIPKDSKEKTDELPYERFLRFGPDSLTEAELLAIIIRTGTRGKSALETARDVLRLARYPRSGLLGLQDLTVEDLEGISGIGEVKAVKLKCITELCKRMSRAKKSEGESFTSSEQVAEYFMEQLRHRETECVMLVCLDSKGQMLCEKKLSEGSVNMSLISPREIFLAALEHKAVNILLVHNHPSGDPTPSRADRELTANVREMGERIGISLLDHVVIGDRCHVSFREQGWFLRQSD